MQNNRWYETVESDNSVVISSRVRLARNFAKYPFPISLNDENAKKIISEVAEPFLENENNMEKYTFKDFKHISSIDQLCLLENHIISPLFLIKKAEKSLILRNDESSSIMINEEDHLRIQTIFAGDNIDEAFIKANEIDDEIESYVDYAFDKEYGYLTACPTNTGTGMRASFMLHLPVLNITGKLAKIVPSISKFRLSLRGLYGEGSEPLGSIYQISNQVTMGCSERETIDNLKAFTKTLIEEETTLTNKILMENRVDVEDKIYRSYGMLAYAKKLSAREAMQLLSSLRVGFIYNILNVNKPTKTIYNIMIDIQQGNIQRISGKELNEQERDIFRAKYIQECLGLE